MRLLALPRHLWIPVPGSTENIIIRSSLGVFYSILESHPGDGNRITKTDSQYPVIRVARSFRGFDNRFIQTSADKGYAFVYEQLAEEQRIDPWRYVDGVPRLDLGYGIPEHASGCAGCRTFTQCLQIVQGLLGLSFSAGGNQ